MNLAQIHANVAGVKLPVSPPNVPSNFYFVPKDYVVINLTTDENEKKYDHWPIVLDLITGELNKRGISIIQVGSKDDPLMQYSLDYRGLTFRQMVYVLENAKAIISNDSYICHIGSFKKKPLLTLISADHVEVALPQYNGPYIYLEADREGNKPSYGLAESKKFINNIKPETVAKSLFQLLELDVKINTETVRVGSDFYINQLDFLNDQPIPADIYNDKKIVSRMDLGYNVQALAQCLYFYRAAIITAKPFSTHILQKFKDKIYFIIYIIDKNYSKGFVEVLHKSGIPYCLMTELEGRELTDIKLDLFDYNEVKVQKKVDPVGIDKNMLFRTNRVFLSNGKFYASAYHYFIGKEYNGSEELVGGALNNKDFLDGFGSYHLFRVLSE